jgi:hypothetical protein
MCIRFCTLCLCLYCLVCLCLLLVLFVCLPLSVSVCLCLTSSVSLCDLHPQQTFALTAFSGHLFQGASSFTLGLKGSAVVLAVPLEHILALEMEDPDELFEHLRKQAGCIAVLKQRALIAKLSEGDVFFTPFGFSLMLFTGKDANVCLHQPIVDHIIGPIGLVRSVGKFNKQRAEFLSEEFVQQSTLQFAELASKRIDSIVVQLGSS